jgi:prepilin-type N-terminal cleavage/methylation domain-containing protein
MIRCHGHANIHAASPFKLDALAPEMHLNRQMKQLETGRFRKQGFTLVELLVVIVIVAALATAALSIGPRMMAKAKAAESMQNIRQIAPLLTTYAADHSMALPPILGPVTQADGNVANVQWNEVCLSLLYPDTDPEQFKTKAWWENNKVMLRNPLLKEGGANGWAPLNPGYAMNEMIVENIEKANGDNTPSADPLSVSVPMARISEPSRTPLIAPYNSFSFRFDDSQISGFKSGTLKDLLVDDKIPVLFVDGHLDVMSLSEYKDRHLAEMPMSDSNAGS